MAGRTKRNARLKALGLWAHAVGPLECVVPFLKQKGFLFLSDDEIYDLVGYTDMQVADARSYAEARGWVPGLGVEEDPDLPPLPPEEEETPRGADSGWVGYGVRSGLGEGVVEWVGEALGGGSRPLG